MAQITLIPHPTVVHPLHPHYHLSSLLPFDTTSYTFASSPLGRLTLSPAAPAGLPPPAQLGLQGGGSAPGPPTHPTNELPRLLLRPAGRCGPAGASPIPGAPEPAPRVGRPPLQWPSFLPTPPTLLLSPHPIFYLPNPTHPFIHQLPSGTCPHTAHTHVPRSLPQRRPSSARPWYPQTPSYNIDQAPPP